MLGAIALLAGCATGSDTPADPPATPASFKEASAAPGRLADAPAQGQWWRAFADPRLDALLERADRDNRTLHIAAARLAESRASLRGAMASRLPLLSLGLNATRQDGPLTNAAGTDGPLFVAGMNLSYEVDLFGRLAKAGEAAGRDVAEREDLLRSARLLVQADVAQSYFTLRALDTEHAIVASAVEFQQTSLRLMQGMARAGLAAEFAVARMRAETEAGQSEALALQRRRAALEHAIALLVGAPASTFHIAPDPQTGVLPSIPPGIPGIVLARRPDVAAARQAMFAAQLRVGVARDAWLPTLSLTTAGGVASPDIGALLRFSAGALGAGALLGAPLFDGGRNEAGVARARAGLDAAAAAYGQQVLVAIRDVEDQLSSLRLLAGEYEALSQASAAAHRSVVLAEANVRLGLVSQLDLLDVRRSELRNRRQALQVQSARFHATIGLVRALGGGWDSGGGQASLPPATLASAR